MPEKTLKISVPGIDLRQAALRLGGDDALFASLLRRVRDEFADTVSRVRDLLAAQDSGAAARLLHTLRGATGNVAATDVAALASLAEAAIKDEEEAEAVENLLKRLDDALEALTSGISASGILDLEAGSVATSSQATINRDQISALMDALTTRSMSALDLFSTLRAGLASMVDPAILEALASDIDNLRFSAAAEKLKTALPQA